MTDNKSITKPYNNPLSLLLLFSSFAAAFNFQLNYFQQQMLSITMTTIMMTKSQNSESNNNNNYLRYLNNCFSFTCHSMRFDSIRLYNSSMQINYTYNGMDTFSLEIIFMQYPLYSSRQYTIQMSKTNEVQYCHKLFDMKIEANSQIIVCCN